VFALGEFLSQTAAVPFADDAAPSFQDPDVEEVEMRKTGRPRGSGYDDAEAIRRILELMQEERATRRSAIIRVCGPDQLRRLEMKMAVSGVARNGRSRKMTSGSTWDYGHRIGVDEDGTTVVLAPRELAGSILALGEDGVDRTPFLLGIARSMVAAGSGLIFIDGTGDATLPDRITEIASTLGRDDDVQVVDFNAPYSGSRLFDPFDSGTRDVLVQICVDLMDYEGPDGAIWKGRAITMLRAVMTALVWFRDEQGLRLNARVVRNALEFDGLIGLSADRSLPSHISDEIWRYLRSIPDFDPSQLDQSPTTQEHHGYLQMQFSQVLGALADINGELFMIGSRSVALDEIALRRRILLVSLPISERLDDRNKHVARLVGASLMAMARDLVGKSMPVRFDEIASSEKSSSPVFPIVLNGVGDFMTEGMETLAGSARGHGFCLVFADRSLDGIAECDRHVADAVVASCRTRIGLGSSGEIDLAQGDRSRRLRPVTAHA
jgi:intracellular multiplication protein IcmO